jgi:hypothetical protein
MLLLLAVMVVVDRVLLLLLLLLYVSAVGLWVVVGEGSTALLVLP